MDNPAFTQQIRALLLAAGGLLIAIFLGMQIGSAKYGHLLLGTVIVAVIFVSFFSGRFFWVLTIASSFLGGTFPVLGGSFTPFQIFMAIGVGKFVIEDVVLRRTRINFGNRFDLLLIAGFMGVLMWHGVHDRFGMRFLGSTVWGGRNYVNLFVGLAAFFIVQSIPMKSKAWSKLPYIVLAVTTFDLAIAVITTVFPKSITTIYPFYSAVSTAGVTEILTGNAVETSRLSGFGNFGVILITLILASVSLRQILHPSNFFRLITVGFASLAVLYSSFRTAVFNTLIVAVVAGIRDLKWGVLALLPFLALLLFGLSVLNSEFVTLPKQVQRSLAFIPGNWDIDMKRDVTSSNDFRAQVWTIWKRYYFPLHPLMGRGFGFRSEWTKPSVDNPKAVDLKQMVEVGNVHNGFFAALDAFGIAGTIFFVIWNVRILVRTFKVPFRRNDPEGTALRFLALSLAAWIIFYWIGASNVGSFLPQEFAAAGVFLRLQRSRESEFDSSRSVEKNSLETVPAETAPA